MLNVKLENLGNIKKAEIQLNKLTIFSGKNNSGKTYVNYILYALLDKRFSFKSNIYNNYIKEAKEDGISYINLEDFLNLYFDKLKSDLEENFKNNLDRFFSAKENTFEAFQLTILEDIGSVKNFMKKLIFSNELQIGKNKIICDISKEEGNDFISLIIHDVTLPNDVYLDFINDVFYKHIFYFMNNDTFLLPAERTGINLFYQELNTYRNSLINNLQKNNINPLDVLKDMMVSKYPQPIADYIEFLNNTSMLKKSKSEFRDLNNNLHHRILKGKYNIDKNGGITFLPYKTYFKGNDFQSKIDLHLTSSTVKTFFSLEFYLENMAKKGAYLIIDEPELNLHPDNQRNIARLLAQIVNRGVNVIISTHSDYIIRELNNLIMLKNNFNDKNKLMQKYEYDENELLSSKDINAYLIDDGKVTLMDTTNDEGIIATTFDKVINNLNSSADDIYYAKQELFDNE